jgi:hypothetical protein
MGKYLSLQKNFNEVMKQFFDVCFLPKAEEIRRQYMNNKIIKE